MKLPPHPLDVPGTLKILLGQTASDLIAAHGDQFFAVISHPDATSPAESAGRMILTILPTDKRFATAACNVALGTHRAVRIKTPKATEAPQG
jgi:hypothetical protein